jgi:hypothetical protein
MHRAIVLIAGLAALAGCSAADHNRVSSTPPTPPTVTYRVVGNDISQANVSAAQYCQRYGTGAQYQGLQPSPSGNVALYTCNGPPVATSGSSAAPYNPQYNSQYNSQYNAPYGAAPIAQCADAMHQDRPGGSDYYGPPVPGCPMR